MIKSAEFSPLSSTEAAGLDYAQTISGTMLSFGLPDLFFIDPGFHLLLKIIHSENCVAAVIVGKDISIAHK